MNFHFLILKSLHYTKESFFGDRTRSIIFVVLGIISGVLSLYHNAIPQIENFKICWQIMYSWEIWVGLIILWLLTNTIIAGYMIRIFRDPAYPPSFDNVKSLIADGIIAEILILIWAVPALIGMFVFSSPVILIVLLVFLIIMFPVSLFLYATTGNITDSLRISKILAAIQHTGWWRYPAAWCIAILFFLFAIVITGIFWLLITLFPSVPVILTSVIKFSIFGYFMLMFNFFFARFFAGFFSTATEKK